jgi:hypothetical protein
MYLYLFLSSVTPSDTMIRRSISQKKSGVSITIDDPVRMAKQPSPPRGKVSNIVHVSNLVRPFTLSQLKELLGRTGTMHEDCFWIDKIKSHCYVTVRLCLLAIILNPGLCLNRYPILHIVNLFLSSVGGCGQT